MRMSNVGWRCVIRVRDSARIRNQRYRQTARGQANYAKHNAHRILIGRDCYARAESVEQAAAINQYIRKRVRERRAEVTACSAAVATESPSGNSEAHSDHRC
jgi:hypothetical protein